MHSRLTLRHGVILPADADATLLLERLGGPEAPASFVGALQLRYRLGPSKVAARLHIQNHFQKSPVWNVIGSIPGTLPPDEDEPVLLGNHRDAWVYGVRMGGRPTAVRVPCPPPASTAFAQRLGSAAHRHQARGGHRPPTCLDGR